MLTSQLNIEFEQLNFQSPILGPFLFSYRSLKTIWQNENSRLQRNYNLNFQVFTANKCEKSPSSIQCWDSNPQL